MNEEITAKSELVMHRRPYPIELSDGTAIECSLLIIRHTTAHRWGVDRTWSLQLESVNGRIILEETDLPGEILAYFNRYMPKGGQDMVEDKLNAPLTVAGGVQ